MIPAGASRRSPSSSSSASCLVAAAVALNVSWILINWREGAARSSSASSSSSLIIAGDRLNTVFLVREMRRNEQQDSFINAVTHELKTPIASIRLYLETLQSRDARRRDSAREFYRMMLEDADRLQQHVEQVLRAGAVRAPPALQHAARSICGRWSRECLDAGAHAASPRRRARSTLSRRRLPADRRVVLAMPTSCSAAVSNLLDNAVKYSGRRARSSVELAAPDDRRVSRCASRTTASASPQAELKRIFRRFYRIPAPWLSVSKAPASACSSSARSREQHGGRVFAESEGPGHGSTFTLQLPRAPSA